MVSTFSRRRNGSRFFGSPTVAPITTATTFDHLISSMRPTCPTPRLIVFGFLRICFLGIGQISIRPSTQLTSHCVNPVPGQGVNLRARGTFLALIPVALAASEHMSAPSLGIPTYVAVKTGIRSPEFHQIMSVWTNSCSINDMHVGLENSDCNCRDNSEQDEEARNPAYHPRQKGGLFLSWENPRLTLCIAFHIPILRTQAYV